MQAFEGYRVLDLTHVLAGPFCTYQLAVLGAEVIKIEPPDELDMVRVMGPVDRLNDKGLGLHFLSQGANKKAITLDLKSAEGREVFKRLAEGADVLVENYRAGALAALGLGYEDLAALNPRLIYCSMTGFGQTGPKRHHTAFDNVIQAFSGLMAATGSPETAPVRVGPPVLDYGTGAQAAFAIAAALLRRERSGAGQHLDVAMLDAALVLMSQTVILSQATGGAPVPPGNSDAVNYGYACYETAEGQVMLGVHTTRQHARLWRGLGREDVAARVAALKPAEIAGLRDELQPLLRSLLLAQPAQHWEDLLVEAGIPVGRVRGLDETLAHPQLQDRAVLQDLPAEPEINQRYRATAAAFNANADGPRLSGSPPLPGQHTDEILAALGYSTQKIDEFRQRGVC